MKDAERYVNYARASEGTAEDIEESYELFKDRMIGVKAVAVPLRLVEGYPDDSFELRQGKGVLFTDGSVLITFGDGDGDGGVMVLDLDEQSDRYTLQTIIGVSKKLYREVQQEEQP